MEAEKKEKRLTWRELRDFVNSVDEQFLDYNVVWWGEFNAAQKLEEDYVLTDYGCEPASAQDYQEDEEPYDVAYEKGHPILLADL